MIATTPTIGGAMFNWKTMEGLQEIFAVTIAVGTLLVLSAVIPV
jgi:hypothetical protein